MTPTPNGTGKRFHIRVINEGLSMDFHKDRA